MFSESFGKEGLHEFKQLVDPCISGDDFVPYASIQTLAHKKPRHRRVDMDEVCLTSIRYSTLAFEFCCFKLFLQVQATLACISDEFSQLCRATIMTATLSQVNFAILYYPYFVL